MSHHLKDRLYDQFARISKALASPRRLELIDILVHAPRTVEDLAREARLSVANASRHLQVLRAAQLVETHKVGLYVHCRIADPEVVAVARAVRVLAEHRLADIERVTREFRAARGKMNILSSRDLLVRARAGEIVVLDVRPAAEFAAAHIARAMSIPLPDLERRIRELPRNKEIVAYCRGPYCIMAVRAVEVLRRRGRRASLLSDGFSEWLVAGLPIFRGAAAPGG